MQRLKVRGIKLAVIAVFSVLCCAFTGYGVSSALAENTFSGVLTNSTGAPLQNISVYLVADNGDSASATTDANGNYSITAPPQAYKLSVNGNGNGPGNLNVLSLRQSQSTVDLSGGNIARDLQIQTATLHVTVQDTNGNPISGAGVTSYVQQGSSVTYLYTGDPGTTISYIGNTQAIPTAGDGTVDITSVVGAQYGDGVNGTSNSYICATVVGGSHCLPSSLTVAGDTNVIITVPVSYTYSGVITDSTGAPLQNMGVYLTSPSGNFGYAISEADGSYNIGLVPDTYAIKISGNGNGPGNLTALIINPTVPTANLTSSNVIQNLQIPTATLHVTVRDASGVVVPDATVTSYVQQGNSPTYLYPSDPGSVIYYIGTQQALSAGPNGTIDVTSVVGATYGTGSYINSVNYLCATYTGAIVCLPAPLTVTGDMNITLQAVPTNTAPVVAELDPATINEGASYDASGSFTDSGSTSWSATVDYGDGAGVQPLTLSGQNFSLQHTYKDEGTYTAIVTVTDNQGLSHSKTATVTVANVAASITPITGIPASTRINTAITTSATFTDPGILDTHTAVWNWGDGTTSAGTVTENNGSGSVTKSHTYTAVGVYTATLTVTDNDGGVSTRTYQSVNVYNPTVTGLLNVVGVFNSPAGAYLANPTSSGLASVTITARYNNGLPTGNAGINMIIGGSFTFNSTSLSVLVISNGTATLRGTGTASGVAGVSTFLVTAKDSTDTFRIQIKNPAGQIVYDTQRNAADTAMPTTAASSVFMQQ